jgi:hypothetical protein
MPTTPAPDADVPQATHRVGFEPAAKVVHDVLGWLLATSATLLAASGQIEYAIAADITDLRRFLVPAILEIAAIFLILGGYLRACDGDSPALLWLLASAVTGFATWTNLTHGGPRAGRIFAAATVVTFVLWLLKLRDRYRAARRASGLIDAPTAKFRLIRWIVMPRLTTRAWLLAIEYNVRDAEEALNRARLWHDTAHAAYPTATGTARHRRAAARTAANLAVRRGQTDAAASTTPAATPPVTMQTTPSRAVTTHDPHPAPMSATEPQQDADLTADGKLILSDAAHNASLPQKQPPPTVVPAASDARRRPPRPAARTSVNLHVDRAPATARTRTSDSLPPDWPPPAVRSRSTPPASSAENMGDNDAEAPYRPTSRADMIMYSTWRRGVALGQEPSGADLARAAGRTDDSTGTGRRAVRRYRDAHTPRRTPAAAQASTTPRPTAQKPALTTRSA